MRGTDRRTKENSVVFLSGLGLKFKCRCLILKQIAYFPERISKMVRTGGSGFAFPQGPWDISPGANADCRRVVRGKRHRVRCSPVGDETVVVIEPCIGADTWTETPTARECEVLMWIARGETDRMIAERFGLKTSTIRTHTERARRKLRASTRTQAVARAISLGLIQA